MRLDRPATVCNPHRKATLDVAAPARILLTPNESGQHLGECDAAKFRQAGSHVPMQRTCVIIWRLGEAPHQTSLSQQVVGSQNISNRPPYGR